MSGSDPANPPAGLPVDEGAEQIFAAAALCGTARDGHPFFCANPANAAIVQAVNDLVAQGRPVTIPAVADLAGDRLEAAGGDRYLLALAGLAPSAEEAARAIATVRSAWLLRQLVWLGERVEGVGRRIRRSAYTLDDRLHGEAHAQAAAETLGYLAQTSADLLRLPSVAVEQIARTELTPASWLVRVHQRELEWLADLNVHLAANQLASDPDKLGASATAELLQARAATFRDMAAGLPA